MCEGDSGDFLFSSVFSSLLFTFSATIVVGKMHCTGFSTGFAVSLRGISVGGRRSSSELASGGDDLGRCVKALSFAAVVVFIPRLALLLCITFSENWPL